MIVGVVGLGRMGYAIAHRAVSNGHIVYGFDVTINDTMRAQAQRDTIHLVTSLQDLAHINAAVIWLMVPAGDIVDNVINTIAPSLDEKTIIVDGGNSFYKDSIRRTSSLHETYNIPFLDCGTSGGIHGIEHGFCLMVGGNKDAYNRALPLFTSIAAPNGVAHVGPSGAGHYVKMIHNGIEYGLLQAYAEGFHLLKNGTFNNELNLHQIAQLWNSGSVIRSFLLELAANIFKNDQQLNNVKGIIAEGGTGRWTVEEAREHAIPAPIIATSLDIRATSSQHEDNYANKVVALLREQFGGHMVTRSK